MPNGWSFSNILPNFRQGLSNIADNGMNNLGDAVRNVGSRIGDAASAVGDRSSALLDGLGNAASNVPGNLMTNLRGVRDYGLGNISNAVSNGYNRWADQGVAQTVANAGENALRGLGAGMTAPKEATYAALDAAVKSQGDQGAPIANFGDILGRYGADPNATSTKIGTFAGDMATDPMTYLLAGPTKLAIGNLTSKAASLGRSALGGSAEGLTANPAMRDALSKVALFKDIAPGLRKGAQVAARGVEMADGTVGPMSGFYGRGLVAAKEAASAELAGGASPAANAAEARLARLTQAAPSASGASPATSAANVLSKAKQTLSQRAEPLLRGLGENPDVAAAYMPGVKAIGLRSPASASFGAGQGAADLSARQMGDTAANLAMDRRHELLHAVIDNAAASGNTQGLGLMPRVIANLQRSAQQAQAARGVANPGLSSIAPTLRGGMANIGHEVAAHMGESRSLLGQLYGGARFLFNPELNARYAAGQFAPAGVNPAVLGLYRSLPNAAGAAPGASSQLLRSLGD